MKINVISHLGMTVWFIGITTRFSWIVLTRTQIGIKSNWFSPTHLAGIAKTPLKAQKPKPLIRNWFKKLIVKLKPNSQKAEALKPSFPSFNLNSEKGAFHPYHKVAPSFTCFVTISAKYACVEFEWHLFQHFGYIKVCFILFYLLDKFNWSWISQFLVLIYYLLSLIENIWKCKFCLHNTHKLVFGRHRISRYSFCRWLWFWEAIFE